MGLSRGGSLHAPAEHAAWVAARPPLPPTHTQEGRREHRTQAGLGQIDLSWDFPGATFLFLQRGSLGSLPTSSSTHSRFLMCSCTQGHSCFLSVSFHAVVAALRTALSKNTGLKKRTRPSEGIGSNLGYPSSETPLGAKSRAAITEKGRN